MQMGKFIPGAWSDPWSLEALLHVLHAQAEILLLFALDADCGFG